MKPGAPGTAAPVGVPLGVNYHSGWTATGKIVHKRDPWVCRQEEESVGRVDGGIGEVRTLAADANTEGGCHGTNTQLWETDNGTGMGAVRSVSGIESRGNRVPESPWPWPSKQGPQGRDGRGERAI